MNITRSRCLVTAAILATLAAAGCAKPVPPIVFPSAPPKPGPAAVLLEASPDANPDATGRPSPVVVRVYQLKADTAFKGAELFSLLDDDEKALGPELAMRDEYVLSPSERRAFELPYVEEVRFVGVIAAFRNVRDSEWRALVPVTRDNLTITVGRDRVAVTSTQPVS
jgi:type VI secretion system protein VasD